MDYERETSPSMKQWNDPHNQSRRPDDQNMVVGHWSVPTQVTLHIQIAGLQKTKERNINIYRYFLHTNINIHVFEI